MTRLSLLAVCGIIGVSGAVGLAFGLATNQFDLDLVGDRLRITVLECEAV